jgi:hypothetical protein
VLLEILCKTLCGFCAIPRAPVDVFHQQPAAVAHRALLSSLSSNRPVADAQQKHISACTNPRYPHFHSDGYYYYLYTSIKTGYSNPSQKQFSSCLSAEEISQWNLA